MKKILITICARGGSKGIPGKNIKPINGKPLIAYSIEIASQFAFLHGAHISLSTDSEEIRMLAKSLDLACEYQRPEYLATDHAGKIDTIKDLLLYEEQKAGLLYDYILDLDITSPLRTLKDISEAFKHLKSRDALSLFSVNRANRNPYFNMVEENDDGYYQLVRTNPDGSVLSRQSAPAVYDLNASFYWYRRAFFNMNFVSPITAKSIIYEMSHICFDLDHQIDFDFLEYLLTNNKLEWFR